MPRAGLSPQAVTDLALAVVDEGGPSGWADLSLAAVAQRAGVAVPSLYKHVGGLPALRVAVAGWCVDDLTAALRAAIAGAGGGQSAEALRAVADATRAYALAHPGRYRAVQGAEATALGARAAEPAELVAETVALLGAPPDRWVDQVRAVRAAVHGFVELELTGGFGMPQDVDASFRYLVGTLVAGLTAPAGGGVS